MRHIHLISSTINRIGMIAAVVILLAMTGLILVEIVMRTFFDASTHMADELVGYGIGGMSFLALGQSLEKGTLIRMNLLLTNLDGGSRIRWLIEILCILFGIFSCGMAFWYFTRNVIRNYERGYVSETIAQVPLWLPESLVAIGLAILLLQFVSYLLRVIVGEADLSSDRAAELGLE